MKRNDLVKTGAIVLVVFAGIQLFSVFLLLAISALNSLIINNQNANDTTNLDLLEVLQKFTLALGIIDLLAAIFGLTTGIIILKKYKTLSNKFVLAVGIVSMILVYSLIPGIILVIAVNLKDNKDDSNINQLEENEKVIENKNLSE